MADRARDTEFDVAVVQAIAEALHEQGHHPDYYSSEVCHQHKYQAGLAYDAAVSAGMKPRQQCECGHPLQDIDGESRCVMGCTHQTKRDGAVKLVDGEHETPVAPSKHDNEGGASDV